MVPVLQRQTSAEDGASDKHERGVPGGKRGREDEKYVLPRQDGDGTRSRSALMKNSDADPAESACELCQADPYEPPERKRAVYSLEKLNAHRRDEHTRSKRYDTFLAYTNPDPLERNACPCCKIL